MESPKYGKGAYTKKQIDRIVKIAYTAFVAARLESFRLIQKEKKTRETKENNDEISERSAKRRKTSGDDYSEVEFPKVIIHTGNWGCGAYGGNPEIMALLQMAAARLAGIDELVYHTFAPPFTKAFKKAEIRFQNLISSCTTFSATSSLKDTKENFSDSFSSSSNSSSSTSSLVPLSSGSTKSTEFLTETASPRIGLVNYENFRDQIYQIKYKWGQSNGT